MIVLDTNVVFELMHSKPDTTVLAWLDQQNAAVCIFPGATLATRNTKHFEQMGLALINPWTQS